MTETRIYPLTFTPVLKDYLWGGRRLETLYGRTLPPGIVAESWEISGHPNGVTVADAGYWAGQPLPAILAGLGERLTGTRAGWAPERGRFPLLVKLLDAHADLSLQVHPDDTYAMTHEGGELGKTEMWYVLHADPGARLILGVPPGTTRESFHEALRTGELEAVLNYVPVEAGQAIPVPAGTVHALLAGIVVAEIQQNSDAGYRVHDWGRVGVDGRPRPLHVEKALDVINFRGKAPGVAAPRPIAEAAGVKRFELVRTRYFVVEEIRLAPATRYIGVCDGATLEIWGCISGGVAVEWTGDAVALPAIRYALLPSTLGKFAIVAAESSRCLRVYLPSDS